MGYEAQWQVHSESCGASQEVLRPVGDRWMMWWRGGDVMREATVFQALKDSKVCTALEVEPPACPCGLNTSISMVTTTD